MMAPMIPRALYCAMVTAACFPVVPACTGPSQPATVAPPTPSTPAEVVYPLFIMDRRAGALRIRDHGDGRRSTAFSFNDRGRGPDMRSEAFVDENGILTSVTISGHDYWKKAVDETFTIEGTRYRWKNAVEDQQISLETAAFYIPINATIGEYELLAQALLKAPEQRLPLLPGGTAGIKKWQTMTVEASGQRRDVTLYALSGLSLTPTMFWLDGDGRFFASASGWSALIREGWQAAIPQLKERQTAAETQVLQEIAARVPRKPDGPLAIRDVAVFDSQSGKRLPAMTVVIEGERIQQVGRTDEVDVPAEAMIIDGRGHTLVPGLWDMHVHFSPVDGVLNLAAGVTSARDLANDIDEVNQHKRRIERGTLIGPRLILAGFMDGTSEYTGPTKVIVDTEEQAQSAIQRYRELGYEQVKLYSSIKPELVPIIAAMAHDAGLRVSGHIPAFMTAEQAVRQGYDEIQHLNMLMLNFMFDKVQDTRTPARFSAIGEYGADLDLQSDNVRQFIALLAEKGTIIDPTLTIFEDMFEARPGQVSPSYAAISESLPVQLQRSVRNGGILIPEGKDERYRQGFRTMLKMLALLHQAGVPIVAGTDALAGFTLHRELELYVEAGISPPEVLRLATLGSAELTGRSDQLGTIAPGKLADMVMVEGNPATNISDIRNVTLTVKGGIIYPAKTLLSEIGISHQRGGAVTFQGPMR